jgi:hypothetical protein
VTAVYQGSDIHQGSSAGTAFFGDPSVPLGPLPGPTPEGCTAPPTASSALNQMHNPNYPDSDLAYYCASWVYNQAGWWSSGTVYVASWALPFVAARMAWVLPPTPHKVAAVAGTEFVIIPVSAYANHASSQSMQAFQTALNDPPDPNFRRIARPGRIAAPRVLPSNRLTRRQARRITRFLLEQARLAAVSRAFRMTVDRAGGAREANDAGWYDLQMRHARKYARRIVGIADRLDGLTKRVDRAVSRLTRFRRPVTRGEVRRMQRRIARHGFSRRELRVFRAGGVTRAQRRLARAVIQVTSQLPAPKPKDIAGLPTRWLRQQYRTLELGFRWWLVAPEVSAPLSIR